MKSTAVYALTLLNVVLLASFIWRLVPSNSAIAQQAAAHRPGDYLLIPALVSGSSSGIVVALDQTNGLLSAISFDESTGRYDAMPKMDLRKIFAQPPTGRAGAAGRGY